MLRGQWLATAALSLTVAVVVGIVLAFAAGAERTSTVADRYTSAQGPGFDGAIYQVDGRPRTAEVAALPGAASVDSVTFIFGAMFRPGSAEGVNASVFSGSPRATGTRLVAGREASPEVAGEFVASRNFINANHAAIGDKFELKTLTQEQADTNGFNLDEPPAGPTIEGVLVGVTDGPASLEDPTNPGAFFSPALLHDPHIGVSTTIMSVGLAAGTDLDAFRAELDTLPGSDSLSLEQGALVSATLRQAIDAQALGLWALSAVAAVAAIVVLAQLITRQVRLSDADHTKLSSIGYVDGQMVGESMARAAVPVLSGTLVGVAIAITLSGVFPNGFVRRIEPHLGVRVDLGVLLLGVAVVVAALMLCTLATLLISRLASRRGAKTTMAIEAIATRAGSATASTGLRFAFGRRGQDGGSTRAIVIGLSLTMACLVGALTFATSLVRLVNQPARYGLNFDAMLGNSGADSIPDDLRSAIESDPDIGGLLLYAEGQARFGTATLRLIGMQPVKGEVAPPVLTGRLPASVDEIALGRLAASAMHTGVGGDLSLDGDGGTQQFHVTGLVVVPSLGINDGIGQDALLTVDGLARLDPTAVVTTAVVKFRDSAPDGAFERLAGLAGLSKEDAAGEDPRGSTPSAIVNVARVRGIPFVLAALLAALAVLTVGHTMVTSVQKRRRDVTILRSMGADRGWIARAVHWQATAFTFLPLLIGIPLGLIIGRIVFRSFADSIGTVDDASLPLLLVSGVVAGLVVIANLIASVPARRADRVAPAVLLRPE
jgi:FtsX-like permease family